jgi:hypothetical protein
MPLAPATRSKPPWDPGRGRRRFLANAMRFGRILRRAGLEVEPGQTATFIRALALLGFARRGTRAAGATIFVRRRRTGHSTKRRSTSSGAGEASPRTEASPYPRSGRTPRGAPPLRRRRPGASRTRPSRPCGPKRPASGLLRTADFATLTAAEDQGRAGDDRSAPATAPVPPGRRSRLDRADTGRRCVPCSAGHSARAGRRCGGVGSVIPSGPDRSCWSATSAAPWSATAGSCCASPGAAQRSGARVEVFVFGTRLTRITRQLRAEPRRSAAAGDEPGGGLERRHPDRRESAPAQPLLRCAAPCGGAVVLVVSDGWERGDPALLAREMATLRRSCHRLLWIDPLAARPGFERPPSACAPPFPGWTSWCRPKPASPRSPSWRHDWEP